MPELQLAPAAAVTGEPAPPAGITDLMIVAGDGGPVLLSATRGGGWLSAHDVATGTAALLERRAIAESHLQLEPTDLALLPGAGGDRLWLAGLASPDLVSAAWQGAGLGPLEAAAAPGIDMGRIAELSLAADATGSTALAGRTGGGLTVIRFGADGQVSALGNLATGNPVHDTRATAVTTLEAGGTLYGVAAFGWQDTISSFRLAPDGSADHVADVTPSGNGPGFAQPGALGALEVGGADYVIAAASGSGSLSVFRVAPDGRLEMTDHLLDSLGTRFADAAHLAVTTLGGRGFVAAAGSDSGLSLFELLPGGRLRHLDSAAATTAVPLGGITDIALSTAPGGELRIWAATEQAPHLVSFAATGLPAGEVLQTGDAGATLAGTAADDVLAGGAGADSLQGGDGHDVLLDGGGADTLQGGPGADVFIFTGDGLTDEVTDFDPGADMLDLTGLVPVWDADDVIVLSRDWGAQVFFHDESFDIRRAGGGALTRDDIVTAGLVTTDRLMVPQAGGEATGSAGDDSLTGTDGADTLTGLGGDDTLSGLAGDDRLEGGEDDDTLAGGPGADHLDGGPGLRDAADYSGAEMGVTVVLSGAAPNAGAATGDLLTGIEELIGSAFADELIGNGAVNILRGGAGDDMINASSGDDTLEGGAGDDTLLGSKGADILRGGAGRDIASFSNAAGSVTVDLAAGTATGPGEPEGDLLSGIEGVFGSAWADVLRGDDGDNDLDGFKRDDLLRGGAGDDTLRGGAGNDTFLADEGADFIDGGIHVDLVDYSVATGAVDAGVDDAAVNLGAEAAGDILWLIEDITGSAFSDVITGNTVRNRLTGGPGDDLMNASSNNDTLLGNEGDDTLLGSRGADVIDGGPGRDEASYSNSDLHVRIDLAAGTAVGSGHGSGDTLIGIEDAFGSRYDDTIDGDGGPNALNGFLGDDVIRGGAGDDALRGGGGADTLSGGAGDDLLIGHTGADHLVFDLAAFGEDRIIGWEDGLDILDFTGSGLDHGDFAAAQVGEDAVLTLLSDPDNSLTFAGIDIALIGIDDFL